MSGGPDDPEDDDRTVIIPAGQSGRPPAPAADAPWPEDEATRAVELTPEPDAPPPADPAATDVWAPPPARTDISEGSVLGNYRVGRLIAQGGLGAIYEGVNIHNPAERVAIKVILPDPVMGDRFAKMLLDEANALMRVRHDAVVPYRTYGRIADTNEFYLVLEYIDGDTLNDFYRRRPLTEPELFALARRLAAGLQASHNEGLVHRDVSPDNVLLPQNQLDKATLIDFGIAKIGDIEDLPDAQFSGKLSYAAPEQFVRGARIGPWTDVYGLALLLVAASRGHPMPMGSTLEEAQEARREVPDLPGVPPRLVAPFRRMLEPHPADRPQSMGEVMALLDAAERGAAGTEQRPAVAPVPPGDTAPPAAPKMAIRRIERPVAPVSRRRRSRGWISALLVLLAAGAVAGGLVLYGDDLFRRHRTVADGSPIQPPATPPPAPAPPSERTRSERLADTLARLRAGMASVPCAVTRVTISDQGGAFAADIGGVWSNGAAVEAAAKSAVDPSVAVSLRGSVADISLCPSLDTLRSLGELGRASLSRPRPGDPVARSSMVTAALPADGSAMLLEIARDGSLTALADLSAGAPRETAIAARTLVDLGGGRYDLTLIPADAKANLDQTLLVLATGTAVPAAATLDAWTAAVRAAAPKPVLDVVPREAAAPAPAIAVPSPTAEEPRDAAAVAIRERLDRVPCSLARIDEGAGGPPFSFLIGGVWGDRAAIDAAIAEAGQASGVTLSAIGETLDPRFCVALDALKAEGGRLGPDITSVPEIAQDDSRATLIDLSPGEGSGFQLFEIDPAGQVTILLDAASEPARAVARDSGALSDLGGGRWRLRLAPPAPTANVDATLLVVVSGETLLPTAAVSAGPSAVADWASRFSAALKGASLDLVARPGIPATPVPPPPIVTPTGTSGVAARFASLGCSMIRLNASAGGTSVEGQWGRESEVRALADTIAQETGRSVTLNGRVLTGRQCAFVDGLKPFFKADAPPSLSPPQAGTGSDGTSTVGLASETAYPLLYLVWVDPAGTVRALIDLSSADTRAAAIAKGRLIDQGNGRFQAVLPRYSPAQDVAPGLLVAVSAASALPAEMLRPRAFRDWLRSLQAAAEASSVRVDITEYRQAATN